MIKEFYKSVLAGVAISIGAMIYLACEDKTVGAILFSLGLISVMLLGFNLYTGKVGYATTRQILSLMGVFAGNCIGALISLYANTDKSRAVVEAKMNKPMLEVFIASVVCGVIIYVCVECWKKHGAWQVSVVGVPVFILIGAEHSVADVCFMIASRTFEWKYILFVLVVAIGNAIGSLAVNLTERKFKKI